MWKTNVKCLQTVRMYTMIFTKLKLSKRFSKQDGYTGENLFFICTKRWKTSNLSADRIKKVLPAIINTATMQSMWSVWPQIALTGDEGRSSWVMSCVSTKDCLRTMSTEGAFDIIHFPNLTTPYPSFALFFSPHCFCILLGAVLHCKFVQRDLLRCGIFCSYN